MMEEQKNNEDRIKRKRDGEMDWTDLDKVDWVPREPKNDVERIFVEAGYDLEFPLNWGGITEDTDLQETLIKTKHCEKGEVFDFVAENFGIEMQQNLNWGKDPKNAKYVKPGDDTFSTKFTDKLRASILKRTFEWYDVNVLNIEPSRGKG